MHADATGTVTLTTPVIFGQALLGPVISQFLDRFPLCDLAIDLNDRQMDIVNDGFDLAIRVGPVGDDTLIVRPLGTVSAGIYRAASAPSIRLDDLSGTPFGLLASADPKLPSILLTSQEGERRVVAVAPRIVCLNPWLLLAAALTTEMTVVLPDIVAAADVRTKRLVRVAPEWSARRVPVSITFPSRRPLRPSVRGFIDVAMECLPPSLR